MRSPWLWLATIISTFLIGLVIFVFPTTPLRPAIVMWFLFVCPGMALMRFLHLESRTLEWLLAMAMSFAIDGIIAGMLLYAGHWLPGGILGALMGLCLAGATMQMAMLIARPPTPEP